MLSRESVIENIRGLIRLSENNNNEYQAKLAASKAAELMAQYNVALREIEGNVSQYIEKIVWSGKGKAWDLDIVLILIREFFFVIPVYSRVKHTSTEVKFFGTDDNIAAAQAMMGFIRNTFQGLWVKTQFAMRLDKGSKKLYYYGLAQGFRQKMQEDRQQYVSNALVLVNKEIQTAFDEKYTNLKRSKAPQLKGSKEVYDKGIEDGKNINLRKVLKCH